MIEIRDAPPPSQSMGADAGIIRRPETRLPQSGRPRPHWPIYIYSRLSELGSLLGLSNFDPIGEVTLVQFQ